MEHIIFQTDVIVTNSCIALSTTYSGHIGKKKNQNEVMVEICSKSLVGAIGEVLRMKFS